MNFYTVTANFDMAQHSDLIVHSFLQLENANAFGQSMKEEFLKQIPCDGALDEEASDHEHDEHFFFYGVSENGENFITIRVIETTFMDDIELNPDNEKGRV
jgi:hypothetical protein